jgi:hypothetical protein
MGQTICHGHGQLQVYNGSWGKRGTGSINGTAAIPKTGNPKFKEWHTRDHYVMSLIFNAMEPQVYEYTDTAKSLWDSILEMYGNINKASRVFELQQQLSQMKQTENQTITEEVMGKITSVSARCSHCSRLPKT